MSIQEDWPDEAAKPRGMSTTAKVLLILGGLFGVCCVLCCGGVIYVATQSVSTDPEVVRKLSSQIVELEIPENFEPKQSTNVWVMKWALYQDKTSDKSLLMLMLMQMRTGQGANDAQQEEAMEKGLQQGGMNANIKKESIDLRDVEIRGKKTQFQFIKGTTDNGKTAVRQVIGAFSGNGGVVLLMLIVPEEQYDEEVVMKMLESIK